MLSFPPMSLMVSALTLTVASALPGKSVSNDMFTFQLVAGVWQERAGGKNWGHDLLGQIEIGEPIFVKITLRNSGMPTPIGLAGPSLAEAPLDLLVTRDTKLRLKEWALAVSPKRANGIINVAPESWLSLEGSNTPGNDRHVSVILWFAPPVDQAAGSDAEEPGQIAGEAQVSKPVEQKYQLLFPKPGLSVVWVRFPRLYFPCGPADKPKWRWESGAAQAAVKATAATPRVQEFAEDIARVIGGNHVVPSQHRDVISKYRGQGDRVSCWADWLLVRSYLGDLEWRAALNAREPNSLKEFKSVEPIARRFLTEQKWIETPPWYDAKLFLAAEFASREPELAEVGVAEVLESYVGARAVWEVGREDKDDEVRPKRRSLTIKLLDREKDEGADKD